MKNVSRTFENIVYGNGNKNYIGKIPITLADGTELLIDNSDIWDGGIQVIDKTSNSGNFDIGFCACDEAVLKINNITGKYSSYDFNNAVARPQTGLQIEDAKEYVKHGVFTVDLPESVGSYISLSCIDNMHKLDRYIDTLTGTSAGLLVSNICTACGVSLKNAGFDGYNKELTLPGNVTEMTYRQALGFICQAIGTFAKFDGDGLLEIKWYDTGAFETGDSLDGGVFDNTALPSYQTGDNADGGDFTFSETINFDGGTFLDMQRYHHVYSMQNLTVATDDVVITGIKVVNEEVSVLFGTEEYALSISDNPFIAGRENDVANYLGQRIVGMRFRPLSITGRSNVLIEAGDPVVVSDRKKNKYQCFATSFNFTIGKSMQLTCDAATPRTNSSDGLSAKTETIKQARKVAKQELGTYDLMVQQLTSLIANGVGVFKSEELDENGGKTYYTHDKPTMAESTIRWYINSGGQVEEKKINGIWTVVSGTDNEGNALYNTLTARGINADWINAGILQGIRVLAETGKIANLEIVPQGLQMLETETTKYFFIEIGNSLMQFFNNEILLTGSAGNGYTIGGGDGTCFLLTNGTLHGVSTTTDTTTNKTTVSIRSTDDNACILLNNRPVLQELTTAQQNIATLQSKVNVMEGQIASMQQSIDYILTQLP